MSDKTMFKVEKILLVVHAKERQVLQSASRAKFFQEWRDLQGQQNVNSCNQLNRLV